MTTFTSEQLELRLVLMQTRGNLAGQEKEAPMSARRPHSSRPSAHVQSAPLPSSRRHLGNSKQADRQSRTPSQLRTGYQTGIGISDTSLKTPVANVVRARVPTSEPSPSLKRIFGANGTGVDPGGSAELACALASGLIEDALTA